MTGNLVEFEFCGKSGVDHCIAIKDKQIARIVQRCSELPGYSVFQYLDEDGTRQRVDSDDVNGYLQTLSGEDFTAKEFRTWAGTVLTTQTLGESQPDPSETKAQQQITAAIKAVAKRLGNRPATCRKYYVHPKIPEFYLTGELSATLMAAQQCSTDLSCHELAVLRILEK